MLPDSHRAVTALALARHAGAAPAGPFGRPEAQEAVCLGTVKEDAPTFSRAANWHFYPANEGLERPVWGFMQPNSRRILLEREAALLDEVARGPSRTLFTLFGRVLHHIQDMSTPAHVVPVYHGPGLADAYEDFLAVQWPAVAAAVEVPADIADGPAGPHPFAGLYEAAAQRTLAELDAPATDFTLRLDEVPQTAGTGLFWCRHDPTRADGGRYHRHGFGRFGVLGRHYGRAEVTVDGHVYRVAPEVYVGLAARFTGHAVADTLRACRCLERLLAG